jgi:DNA-directed RNA polymerase subunit beta
MSWEGYNFEDAIILSRRLVKDDELTSIHIEEYEIDARTTKLGDEEITRDIPNRSEESLRNLDDRGIVRIGAEVAVGRPARGQGHAEGRDRADAEEKLIRAIFKEKAREVRDTSLKVPHGEGGVVIDVKTFSRAAGRRPVARASTTSSRVRGQEAQDLRGRQARRPPRQQGRDLQDRAREDMPFLEDGTPVDVILNPLGVPSRMNIGQILETHLGWAAARAGTTTAPRPYKRAPESDNGRVYVATPVFDGATLQDVDNALVQWQKEHKGAIRMDVDEKRRGGEKASGKLSSSTAAPASRSRSRSPSATCTS